MFRTLRKLTLLNNKNILLNNKNLLNNNQKFLKTSVALAIQKDLGINSKNKLIHYNLHYDEIRKHKKERNEGHFVKNGTFLVDTGNITGRSPKDKWIVKQEPSENNIWWGEINQPITSDVFDELYDKSLKHFNKLEHYYVFDGFCGSHKKTRKRIRFITELAWQHHFVRNMFIRAESEDELKDFEPDFTIINACNVTNPHWERHGLNSENFIAFNIEKKLGVIGGTSIGCEMKKGIFTMMNYWLPLEGIMPMHCSANKGKNDDTALFFGLSGTGKTTLSADPDRYLIGDDEHGWNDEGIFNFEGGCYAKTIGLTAEKEPSIHGAIKKNAILENVWVDPETNEPDFFNDTKTQNGRVAYPIYHIDNHEPLSLGGHPENIIFLTCDAFGVLPPVSKLSSEQAMYHFLSGYTAKIAGTEDGIDEPEATFSACFGAAFLTLHPTKYADLLQQKLEKHGSKVWLVNTGWSGGKYGVGERMDLKITRKCVTSILDGSINNTEYKTDPTFGFKIPQSVSDIPNNVLNPRKSWTDKEKYDETSKKLAKMFHNNFQKYIEPGLTDYSPYGPKI